MIVLGMISGTSVDAIDVAAAELGWDGGTIVLRPLGHAERPWPEDLRERLLAALPPAPCSAAELCQLDALTGEAFAEAADWGNAHLTGGRAELVASHGQTVFHWVEDGRARGTLQIGQPAFIAERTGLPVVSDLRARDVAAGGHGAPLASTLDALWLAGGDGPRAALNLGGIANVTMVGRAGEPVLAFDTGPANCLMDAAVLAATGRARDEGGALAAAGSVRQVLLARLLAEPYYRLPPPKSTGRELFHAGYVAEHLAGLPALALPDLIATLAELTAVTVADACRGYGVAEVVASGGGTRNPALIARLATHLDPIPLVTSEERGLPADGKEAYLFALLGFLTWHGVPGTVPGATGARGPRLLGRISPGAGPLVLPAPMGAPAAGLRIVRDGGGGGAAGRVRVGGGSADALRSADVQDQSAGGRPMSVADILHRKGSHVVKAVATESVSAAVKKLAEHRIGAVIVEDQWMKLVGIFSERDLLNAMAREGARALDHQVSELMTTHVITCQSSDRVESVLALMTMRRIRHLPVVDDGQLKGIISIGDLVKHRLDEKELEASTLLDISRRRAG